MNAIAQMAVAGTEWDDAVRAVNQWRGHLVHVFTRGEAAASETLLALAAVAGRGASVRLRHLLGQRLEDLLALLSAEGAFSAEGSDAVPALSAFREHEPLRPLLCHGLARVWLNRDGEWAVSLDLLAFRSGREERQCRFLSRSQALDLAKDVGRRCQRMEQALARVRAAVAGER